MDKTHDRILAEFRAQLAGSGLDYSLVDRRNNNSVHIRFTGPFLGREVIWDARIITLDHYRQQSRQAAASGRFIEVGEDNNGYRELTVCIDIARLDEPEILKTIIMIRKYRRLRIGRHEFGAAARTDRKRAR